MAATRTFLLINLAIVIFNATLGILVNLAAISERKVVVDRYVDLEENIIIDGQQLDDLITESPLNYTEDDTGTGSGGCVVTEPPKKLVLDASKGLLDKARSFKTHPFVTTGELWANTTDEWRVCLSTQTSPDRLFNVAEQAATWTGPMSISVFVPAEDYTIALKMIQYMRKCFPAVRERASFHMTYPKTLPPKLVPTENLTSSKLYNCATPDEVNKLLVKEVRSEQLLEVIARSRYPQNLLRNVARGGCQSEYIFTPDVDMISIPNLSNELNEFLGRNSTRNCNKCAYIIPTYEISVRASATPKDKTELVRMTKKKLAQRFHIRVFSANQGNSLLSRWEKEKKGPKLGVLYNITSWKSHWEPVYVAKAPVPPFDERFIGYGFTRNSQVFEMHVAGYTWHMMNNIFLTHHGFQTVKHYTSNRRSQIAANGKRYTVFKKEIYARYGVKEEASSSEVKKQEETKKVKKKEEEAKKKAKEEEAKKKAKEEEAKKKAKEEEESKKTAKSEETKTVLEEVKIEAEENEKLEESKTEKGVVKTPAETELENSDVAKSIAEKGDASKSADENKENTETEKVTMQAKAARLKRLTKTCLTCQT